MSRHSVHGVEPEGQLSVGWEGQAPEHGGPTLDRAAAYIVVLARTLTAAGYRPRQLSVGVRRERADVLRMTVRGDVPGLSAEDFENMARVTLNGVGAEVGLVDEGDLLLATRLVSPARPGHLAAARRDLPWAMIAAALAVGLLLGVVGLPRLDMLRPAAAPTAVVLPRLGPTPVRAPTTGRAIAAPTPSPTVAAPRVLFADRFDAPLLNWPNNPDATAWFAAGQYRLFARHEGQFVATGVPLPAPVGDATLSAQFQKLGGPAGGGYGLIVRDQGPPSVRDGLNQGGEYVVLEVGDRGDIGIWQRDQTRWIDVVPWTHSTAVHPDRDPNALTVTTRGTSVRFEVNGIGVAEVTYTALPAAGGVGLFAGGDLNDVAVEWLRITSP